MPKRLFVNLIEQIGGLDKMNWLDLYNFLHQQANDIKAFGKFDWQKDVKVYDNAYGGLFNADLIEFDDFGRKEFYLNIDSGEDNGS
jgi:hypothetical protein